jgi:lauroyl/myristoyl acyltransferase
MSNNERRSAYYDRLNEFIMTHPEKWVMLHNWRKYRALLNKGKEKCLP